MLKNGAIIKSSDYHASRRYLVLPILLSFISSFPSWSRMTESSINRGSFSFLQVGSSPTCVVLGETIFQRYWLWVRSEWVSQLDAILISATAQQQIGRLIALWYHQCRFLVKEVPKPTTSKSIHISIVVATILLSLFTSIFQKSWCCQTKIPFSASPLVLNLQQLVNWKVPC